MIKKIRVLLIFFLATASLLKAQDSLSVADFGLQPNSGQDARPFVKKVLEASENKHKTIVYFPKGRYDFYPESWLENMDDVMKAKASVGFSLRNLKNVTFDGGGSEFVFHGKMQIAEIVECANITLRNFTVDWDRPFISQGEIMGATSQYLDLKIDRNAYPYVIENNKVFFIGEGWKLPVLTMYSTLYDKQSKEIVYNTWDASLGDIFEKNEVEEIQEGIIRFYGNPKIKPANGTIVSLFHVRYFAQGIEITHSKDVLLKDLSLYHTLGNAVLGYRTENITMDNASVTVNDAKGRYFSSVADASHFSECKGTIKVLNCAHTGQGDDFINVHGTSVKITKIINDSTIEISAIGKGNGNSMVIGDEYWFINIDSGQRGEVRDVKSKKDILLDSKRIGYEVTFNNQLPRGLKAGDFLECKTWTAGLEIRNCRILKQNRARGILVTTPEKVIIEDNYFSTAGSAILLEGDFDYWFESGANSNVLIRNNIFDNCLTSGNKNGSRGEWGEAIITITPSFIPKSKKDEPYHKNIIIRDNVFRVFDAPLVRAVSTRNLQFLNNEIIKTYDYKPYTWQKSAFLLNGCRDVKILNNTIDSNYTSRVVQIENMKKTDVKTKKKFRVVALNDMDTQMEW